MKFWNNWTWARQSYKDYSLLIFDMVSTGEYNYQRFPIAFIEDKDGNLIFENLTNVNYKLVKKYTDSQSGKAYPQKQIFNFDNGDKHLHYELTENKIIESQVAATAYTKEVAAAMKAKGLNPSYARYEAEGKMIFSEKGKADIERNAPLICEFMYPGAVDFDKAIEESNKNQD